MKNLFLGAFMLAFTAVATAQTDNKATQTTSPATTTQQATTTTAQPATTMQPGVTTTTTQAQPDATATAQPAAAATTTTAAADQGDYNKIQQSQIAPAVLKTAVAKYKDYALVEALIAEDGSNYKLVLTKDGKDVAAYYKSNGEFIKEETV